MGKIDRCVEIEIGGEKRKVKFTISALEELEAMLPERNVFALIQKEHWSISEIVSAALCGLKVFNRKLNRAKVEGWVSEYARKEEKGILDLRLRLLAAVGLSGLVGGEVSAFQEILNALNQPENEYGESEEEAEGK